MTARSFAVEALRRSFDRLPEGVRDDVRRSSATVRGLTQVKRNQAALALRLADLERAHRELDPEPLDERFGPGVLSRTCTQDQVESKWFRTWCEALGEEPEAHRKLWEWAYLVRTLDALDVLGPGRRGLGFGVGRESMVAFIAGRGVEVVATDLAPDAAEARLWTNADQHASGVLDDLARPELCDPEAFAERVTWRPVDMREVPDDLTGFDFCWSACAFEHLGTIDAGLDFVTASLRTLRPGGIAVHTTELNLDSDEDTIESGPTVLYRRRDIRALAARLEAEGHEVATLHLEAGTGAMDAYVDVPPYVAEPHIRLLYRNHVTTSVALVVRAGSR
ncbi:class I SAM-dependent methyltransferase [Aquihabitans sp. G128]|uniref:SAM-dependent methyltransferase n=1 Tax=Aquihabitans sp. G128 TaxID=2849779 RepID=UPI001C215239|nr:class I SAM-dependent methyltransferase [Aquihabitans sp. G128]QXC62956.1 class I SAM-dependent methyltransferase [Aquihabitans sp. G128]